MKKFLTNQNLSILAALLIGLFVGGIISGIFVEIATVDRLEKKYGVTKNTVVNNDNKKEDNSKNSTPKIATFKFGDEFKASDFSFKAIKVENTKQINLEREKSQTTNMNFVTVRLQYTNISKLPLSLTDYNFIIVNAKDKKIYNLNSDVSISLNSNLKHMAKQKNINYLYDDVNPDMTSEVVLVFEIPTEATSDFVLGIESRKDSTNTAIMNLF